MSTTFRSNRPRRRAQRISLGLAIAAGSLFRSRAKASLTPVNLGSDSSFAVLAGAGITIAGAVDSSTIAGDIGSSPTPSITGLGDVVLNGVDEGGNAVAQAAQTDLLTAFDDAAGRPATIIYPLVSDLGGLTLTTGVYNDPTSFGLTGTLTLDAQGDPDAIFIFQTGTTLITGADSTVLLIGDAQAANVFWEVGSSATLGANSDFVGDLLATTSITVGAGATVNGRLLALNGAVTLDGNDFIAPTDLDAAAGGVPDSGATLGLFASGLAALVAFGRGQFLLRRRYREQMIGASGPFGR